MEYTTNIYKKPGQEDYMSLDRIEDMLSGFRPMLAYLVEDLVFKGKINEAKGVVIRNNLDEVLRQDVKE